MLIEQRMLINEDRCALTRYDMLVYKAAYKVTFPIPEEGMTAESLNHLK